METCGSCHDNVNFRTGEGHSDASLAVNSNADCTLCHADGGFVGSIDDSHAIPSQVAAEAFQYNILSVANTAPGQFPVGDVLGDRSHQWRRAIRYPGRCALYPGRRR